MKTFGQLIAESKAIKLTPELREKLWLITPKIKSFMQANWNSQEVGEIDQFNYRDERLNKSTKMVVLVLSKNKPFPSILNGLVNQEKEYYHNAYGFHHYEPAHNTHYIALFYPPSKPEISDEYIRSTLLHEFGHALDPAETKGIRDEEWAEFEAFSTQIYEV